MRTEKSYFNTVSLKFSKIVTPIAVYGVQNRNFSTSFLLCRNSNCNKLSIVEMKPGKIWIGRKQFEIGSGVINWLWVYQQAIRVEMTIYPYRKLSPVALISQTFIIFTIFFQDKASCIYCKALVSLRNRFNLLYASALTLCIFAIISRVEDIGIQNHNRRFATISHCWFSAHGLLELR
jgi:hypothetical protein